MRPGWAVALFAMSALAQEAAKTGSVSGTVVDAQSNEPVPKVLVVLSRNATQIGARSDSNGKFALKDLEPGAYSVEAQLQGYLAARGSTRQLTVAAGADLDGVSVKLTRTGVATGRVIDADGEPVSGAAVQLLGIRKRPGPVTASSGATDDRGQYRIYYVPPGDYRAAVVYSPNAPYAHIRIQNAGKDAPGAYPTVYYPSTADESQAAVVHIEPGAEVSGIDIQLIRARGVAVRGRVLKTAGEGGVQAAFVTMVPMGRGGRASPGRTFDRLVQDPGGAFEFNDVLPGRYLLNAHLANFTTGRQDRSAKQVVEVRSADVEGLELAPGPPVKVEGRFVPPEGRKLPAGLMIFLASRDPGDSNAGGFGPVKPDGSFTVDSVAPGEYDVGIGSMNQAAAEDESDDLYVSAIRYGDEDALAGGLRISGGQPSALEILVKANGAQVEAFAADEKGAPVPGAAVELVPDPPKQNQLALIGNCKAGADGKCKISGIAPGAYHCYALTEETQFDIRESDALKAFEKFGRAVRVEEGERKTLTVPAVPPE